MEVQDNSSIALPSTVKLVTEQDWVEWIEALEDYSRAHRIWHRIDPKLDDAPDDHFPIPEPPTWESAKAQAQGGRTEEPSVTEINGILQAMVIKAQYDLSSATAKRKRDDAVRTWIVKTVNRGIYQSIEAELRAKEAEATTSTVPAEDGEYKAFTTRTLLKELKKSLAPSEITIYENIRSRYNAVLQEAHNSGTDPRLWFNRWSEAQAKAVRHKVPEVQGVIAIHNFLNAVGARFTPLWATTQRNELIMKVRESAESIPTLKEYGANFRAILEQTQPQGKKSGIFATLGERSDSPKNESKGNSRARKAREPSQDCPCKDNRERYHPWPPEQCRQLNYAVTGRQNDQMLTIPSAASKKAILARYNSDEWKDLRAQNPFRARQETGQGQGSGQYPATLNAAVIIPITFPNFDQSPGIYSTLENNRHPLSQSTLLDTCGAIHLVNDRNLLEEGTFVETTGGERVESGTTSFPIIGKGKRIIRELLRGPKGENTVDLVLNDVAVVEGFHSNIVSEPRLRLSNAWYSGYDCTLRFGSPSECLILARLVREHNLVFLQYNPIFSSYKTDPIQLEEPSIYTVSEELGGANEYGLYATTRRRRPTYDPPLPRSDSEHLWHLRAGHLGPAALRAMVYQARNVKINGIKQLDCEFCATAEAANVISRRPSERASPRPFWRIHWDLQDYPRGFDGSSWLLVIKDEFSGMLYAYPLPNKELLTIFYALFNFVSMVKRQYGLDVCIMRQDNEKAVIAIKGETLFQREAATKGLILELAPPYTHEPNGAAERANKVITVKSIKMLHGANLPETLWTESTVAAAYLHNISPSQANGMLSPTDRLERWFKHHAPLQIRAQGADLRPDWSGIYAYRYRAYALHKDREADRNRKSFKTRPRGLIGYLIGYSASNIYHIWIPRLGRVLKTRNVKFNEEIFFNPAELSSPEHEDVVLNELFDEIQQDEDYEIANLLSTLQLGSMDNPDKITPIERTSWGVDALESARIASESSVNVEKDTSAPIGLHTPRETPERDPDSAPDRGREYALNRLEAIPESNQAEEQSSEPAGIQPPAEEAADDPQTLGLDENEQDQHESDASGAKESSDAFHSAEESGGEVSEVEEEIQVAPTRGSRLPTRSSARLRGEAALRAVNDYSPDRKRRTRRTGPTDGIYAVVLGLFDSASARGKTDHLNLSDNELKSTRTLFATLSGAAEQKQARRLGAAPSKTTIHFEDLAKPPNGWKDMLKHPLRARFEEAAHVEINALRAKGTWKEIPISQARSRPLPTRWVFTYKFNQDGILERCKARLVVRGDLQDQSTIDSTYAATLAARSFRVLVALVARFDLELKQYDVKNAFLNASRNEQGIPVTVQMPEGFPRPNWCLELGKALYGLRDSPQLWFNELSATLQKLGMESCPDEPCLFYTTDRKVFVEFHVDDILIAYHKEDEALFLKIERGLEQRYELHKGGNAEWFLGIKIIRERPERKIYLSHDTYLEKVAQQFGLAEGNWDPDVPVPVKEYRKNEGTATIEEIKWYQRKIGSVLYAAVMLRPDAAFGASLLSRFLTNPSKEHHKAADQLIRYLYVWRHLAVQYGGSGEIEVLSASSDASFGDDLETRRSSQGYLITLFGGPILWNATRQSTVSTSTTEAELIALGNTARETIGLQRLFHQIKFEPGVNWNINCDNQQTIRLVLDESTRINTRLRHVDIQSMWLRQEYRHGKLLVTYLPTQQMPADGLTKALPRQQFEQFRKQLNLADLSQKRA